MIYLFTGTDEVRVRAKAFAWIEKARTKEPNVAYVRLFREEISEASVADICQSQGLFVHRLLVLVDDPYARGNDEGGGAAREILEANISALTASDNAIVLLAPRMTAAQAKKWEASAKMTYRYDQTEARAERGFNNRLVLSLAEKSPDKLWLEIVRALRAGDAPEMIHGLLHWKVRDIASKGDHRWSFDEARAYSRKLILLISDTRRRGISLSDALEGFALSFEKRTK